MAPSNRVALTSAVNLDGLGSKAQFYPFSDEGMGNRVVVPVEFDVIVDADLRVLPLGKHKGVRGKRAQGGLVEALEQVSAARATC